jgi:hypothetical protein
MNGEKTLREEPTQEIPQCLEDGQKILCESEERWEQQRRIVILKKFEVNIKFHDRGCTVGVGCKSFAFENVAMAVLALKEYIEDPAAVINEYGFKEYI